MRRVSNAWPLDPSQPCLRRIRRQRTKKKRFHMTTRARKKGRRRIRKRNGKSQRGRLRPPLPPPPAALLPFPTTPHPNHGRSLSSAQTTSVRVRPSSRETHTTPRSSRVVASTSPCLTTAVTCRIHGGARLMRPVIAN